MPSVRMDPKSSENSTRIFPLVFRARPDDDSSHSAGCSGECFIGVNRTGNVELQIEKINHATADAPTSRNRYRRDQSIANGIDQLLGRIECR